MAIKIAFTTKYGIDLPEAYAKISSFNGNKDNFYFIVNFYATQAARDAGTPMLEDKSYQYDTTEPQNVASLYTYLKTLPEFASAVDC